jgi:hypothetical protein
MRYPSYDRRRSCCKYCSRCTEVTAPFCSATFQFKPNMVGCAVRRRPSPGAVVTHTASLPIFPLPFVIRTNSRIYCQLMRRQPSVVACTLIDRANFMLICQLMSLLEARIWIAAVCEVCADTNFMGPSVNAPTSSSASARRTPGSPHRHPRGRGHSGDTRPKGHLDWRPSR